MNKRAVNRRAVRPVKSKPSMGMLLKRFVKTPKGHVLGALILLTLVGSLTTQGRMGIPHALAAAATGVIFDAAVAKIFKRKVTFSIGGLITGLIVADVLSGLNSIPVVVLTTGIALASKHLLKRGRKPIFNPAAVGLLAAVGIFSAAESWWAGMALTPVWDLLLMLAVGIFVAVRVKKYTQVLTFLATYFALMLVMALMHWGLASATPADALREPFVNSALFLAFFMLTDPPTTPSTNPGQILFAFATGIVSVLMYMLFGGLTYLLVGLLAGNLFTVGWAMARGKPAQKTLKAAEKSRQSMGKLSAGR